MDMMQDRRRRLATLAFFAMIAGPLAAAVGFPMLPAAWEPVARVASLLLGIVASGVYAATHERR